MPTSMTSLVIVLFAILPGIPAYSIYKMLLGQNWRDSDWEKIAKILLLSLAGVIAYVIFARYLVLPMPSYLIPTTFEIDSFGSSNLFPIAISLLGHFSFSVLSALAVVSFLRLLSKWVPSSLYPSAWDDFIRSHVPDHWVVISLNNGEAYAGFLRSVDASVNQSDRDLVLREPAHYKATKGNYEVTSFQDMFIPAGLISSIATVHDPAMDKRITSIGNSLFPEELDHE